MRNIPCGMDASYLYLHHGVPMPRQENRVLLNWEKHEERLKSVHASIDAVAWLNQDAQIVFPGICRENMRKGTTRNLSDTWAAEGVLDWLDRQYHREVHYVQLYPCCLERCAGSMNDNISMG